MPEDRHQGSEERVRRLWLALGVRVNCELDGTGSGSSLMPDPCPLLFDMVKRNATGCGLLSAVGGRPLGCARMGTDGGGQAGKT